MAFPPRAEGALSVRPPRASPPGAGALQPAALLPLRPAACCAVAAGALQPAALLPLAPCSLPLRPAACRAVAAGALQPAAVEPARHRERSRTGQRTLLPGSGARALEGRLALISTKMDAHGCLR